MAGKRTVTIKLSEREYWLLRAALDKAAEVETLAHGVWPSEGFDRLARAYRKLNKHAEKFSPILNPNQN